jgi:hypothetical protein
VGVSPEVQYYDTQVLSVTVLVITDDPAIWECRCPVVSDSAADLNNRSHEQPRPPLRPARRAGRAVRGCGRAHPGLPVRPRRRGPMDQPPDVLPACTPGQAISSAKMQAGAAQLKLGINLRYKPAKLEVPVSHACSESSCAYSESAICGSEGP